MKKLPLGALSQAQVAKGHQCLVELKKAIKSGSRAQIEAQTNIFYSLIPHNFGRQRPPLIGDDNALLAKVGSPSASIGTLSSPPLLRLRSPSSP